ncbi:hypothetical protein E4U41_003639 [Claviceps citrina]|nr:hypothetical protein E4U41_003639 [Claviceps citrina]
MEPTPVGVTANEGHQEHSQKISDSTTRKDEKSSKQFACHQNSPGSASKTKTDSHQDSLELKPSKKTSKPGTSGRKTRPDIKSRDNQLISSAELPASDSNLELDSSNESDDGSATGTVRVPDSSVDDESDGKGKSRRSKRCRPISFNPVVASSQKDKGSNKSNIVASQQDVGQALAQLELRCGQLQHQLDLMNGFQAPQPNRPFPFQQQPVFNTFGSPYATADLAHGGHPSIAQTNHRGLKPSASIHLVNPFTGGIVSSPDDPRNNILGAMENRHNAQDGAKLGYKRVDAVWDSTLYCFKLQTTAKVASDSKYEGYLFHVRRTFDTEGRYQATFVDIKSQLLRECLQVVIGDVRGVNLVDELPKIDPNLLFLYLDDLRLHLKYLKKAAPAGRKEEWREDQHRLDKKRKELKVLIKYLDKDYAKVKESLYPMLKSGIINFEYLWALWKPNTLVYSATYGQTEDPRVFKVDMAVRHASMFQGTFYVVDGRYVEFDGERFGFGGVAEHIAEFQGTRQITSLPFYPLSYHKDELKLRQTLIDRGMKFVSLSRAHFKEYSGLAYMRRKKGGVVKVHIQKSRIMVDPGLFRRINPNYFVSEVRPEDCDALSKSGMSDGDDDTMESHFQSGDAEPWVSKPVLRTPTPSDGHAFLKAMQGDFSARITPPALPSLPSLPTTCSTAMQEANSIDSSTAENLLDTLPKDSVANEHLVFTDEEYLLASPIVLGFSFSEKQWLEFSVSKIREIKWNEDAWESLVLPPETKDLIKALVKSRKHNLAQTIDDVIQGKGKGLVSVLHGPPGTGKTLTAEGISELLQCPLYMVSAGELGTSSQFLETELQKILEICHSWGAILLLDEADVFLEKRNMQDVHRNALVSIFLRQLEYFQGILFLTTNRVETFDEAFQSRIHIALRYDGLDSKAKKAIFKMFIDRVEAHGQLAVEAFTDEDLNQLVKHDLNGREIKNMIGSAQDLALNKAEALSMRHLKQVLEIHIKFRRDLQGGTGYEDAMRNYC